MAKRNLDPIDLAAERESAAIRSCRSHVCKPWGWNRRTLKTRAAVSASEKRVECKTIKERYTRI